MKFVVAGSGSIGRRHIDNIRRLRPEATIVLLRAGGRKDAFSESQGLEVVSDLNAVEAPALVVIATPSSLHADLLSQVIERNWPAYVEKPLVTDRRQLDHIIALRKRCQYDAPVVSGCNLRFLPSLHRLKTELEEGTIGELGRVNIQTGQWLPDWRPGQDYRRSYSVDPSLGGGVILDLVHELDAVRWLCGEMEVKGVAAGRSPALSIDAESQVVIALRAKSNEAVISVGLDYLARPAVRRYEFYGSQGTLCWDLPANRLELLPGSGGRRDLAASSAGFDVPQTYMEAMASLLASVEGSAKAGNDLDEGLRSAELAIQVKERL